MAKSVYEMVTDRIIEQLENGVIPWEKTWTDVRSGAFNRVSRPRIKPDVVTPKRPRGRPRKTDAPAGLL